jgi:hypothetical protein
MFSIWTERTNITGLFVNETVPDHLILPLETFASFGARATLNRARVSNGVPWDGGNSFPPIKRDGIWILIWDIPRGPVPSRPKWVPFIRHAI